VPDILAAKGKAKGLQTHGLVGDIAGEDDQVGPADLVAVAFLDRPQQPARLVEVGVVRPGIQRCKALVAGAGATAAVGETIGAGGMPGHADHQSAVVAPVRRPPLLAVGQQRGQIFLERGDVELFHFLAIVEARSQGIGLAVVLVENVQVQGLGPPGGVRHAAFGGTAVQHGAAAG